MTLTVILVGLGGLLVGFALGVWITVSVEDWLRRIAGWGRWH